MLFILAFYFSYLASIFPDFDLEGTTAFRVTAELLIIIIVAMAISLSIQAMTIIFLACLTFAMLFVLARILPHRGLTHRVGSALGFSIASALLGYFFGIQHFYLLFPYAFFPYISHIAIDAT